MEGIHNDLDSSVCGWVNNITFSGPSAGSTYLLPTSICLPPLVPVAVRLLGFILATLSPRTPPPETEIDSERHNRSKNHRSQ